MFENSLVMGRVISGDITRAAVAEGCKVEWA